MSEDAHNSDNLITAGIRRNWARYMTIGGLMYFLQVTHVYQEIPGTSAWTLTVTEAREALAQDARWGDSDSIPCWQKTNPDLAFLQAMHITLED